MNNTTTNGATVDFPVATMEMIEELWRKLPTKITKGDGDYFLYVGKTDSLDCWTGGYRKDSAQINGSVITTRGFVIPMALQSETLWGLLSAIRRWVDGKDKYVISPD